jgi:hypothetical protein
MIGKNLPHCPKETIIDKPVASPSGPSRHLLGRFLPLLKIRFLCGGFAGLRLPLHLAMGGQGEYFAWVIKPVASVRHMIKGAEGVGETKERSKGLSHETQKGRKGMVEWSISRIRAEQVRKLSINMPGKK